MSLKEWSRDPRMKAEQNSLEKVICEAEVEIKNADGLHMRPAMQFVDIANQYKSDVTVSNNETQVDGKSIMQMSILAATCGTKLKIKAEGSDACKVVDALRVLVEDKMFGEPAP
ncbi:MAG: HPr family phosphocarrier protein [Sedimentisphaerales bacterium]|nr:HPr family phosphocarrier protein [Sedimentisphaerales bacterium]